MNNDTMTPRPIERHDHEYLERLIDVHSLPAVLEAIGELAYAKAQHIEESWQDKALARRWIKASNRIYAARDAVAGLVGD